MGYGPATAGRITVQRRSVARRRALIPHEAARVTVGTAMFVCAFALWTVAPAWVLWVIPWVVGTGSSVLPALVIGGVVVVGIALGKVLAILNELYCRIIQSEKAPGLDASWRRPLCNAEEGRRPTGLLEAVLVSSALTAAITLAVWFLFFAKCAGGACAG
jgi:hypothetical protein